MIQIIPLAVSYLRTVLKQSKRLVSRRPSCHKSTKDSFQNVSSTRFRRSKKPWVLFTTPPLESHTSLQTGKPTQNRYNMMFSSRRINYWTLISFHCLSYLSLLNLPASCMQLLSGLYCTVNSIKLHFSVTSAIFYPATKFCLSLPLSEIYFHIQILSNIHSSMNSFKFTSQYVSNGRVQRSFTEKRAEIPDIL
jgi:hypothetical protein